MKKWFSTQFQYNKEKFIFQLMNNFFLIFLGSHSSRSWRESHPSHEENSRDSCHVHTQQHNNKHQQQHHHHNLRSWLRFMLLLPTQLCKSEGSSTTLTTIGLIGQWPSEANNFDLVESPRYTARVFSLTCWRCQLIKLAFNILVPIFINKSVICMTNQNKTVYWL